MTLYYSPLTRQTLTADQLWKLYGPVKHRYRFKEFYGILGYEKRTPEEMVEILSRRAGTVDQRNASQLVLIRHLLGRLKALSVENEALRNLSPSSDPLFTSLSEFLKGEERSDPSPNRPTSGVGTVRESVEVAPLKPKGWSVNWRQMTAFMALLVGASLFALTEEFLNSQFYRAWVLSHPWTIGLSALFGAFTIAGIYKSIRRRVPGVI